MKKISRKTAFINAHAFVDNALSEVTCNQVPANTRYVVWGGKPVVGSTYLIIGCCSYLGTSDGQRDRLDDDEAKDIAIDFALEKGMLLTPIAPDYVL